MLRVCLWSRLCTRVLMPVAEGDDPYALANGAPWADLVDGNATFAVKGPLQVKDGYCDYWRSRTGARPSVDTKAPAVRLVLVGRRLCLDMSGRSLSHRGYRRVAGLAPMRETLAAGMLHVLGWHDSRDETLHDPMCGAGTLVIEAAMIRGHMAPGIFRRRWGFDAWRGLDAVLWQRLQQEARRRVRRREFGVSGGDSDGTAILAARANARRVGLDLPFFQEEVGARHADWLACNPPLGQRLGTEAQLPPLYRSLGRAIALHKRAAVLVSERALGYAIGMRADRVRPVMNGPLACAVLRFQAPCRTTVPDSAPLSNRLHKNHRTRAEWARRERTECYRVYDADLSDFPCAIDRYGDAVHVQEYEPRDDVPPGKRRGRVLAVFDALASSLGVHAHQVYFKRRARGALYGPMDDASARWVREGDFRFLVRLGSALDTGLFADLRHVRRWVGRLAAGKAFLNLFAYTGTASVYARGASTSVSVDHSHTYCDWAGENFRANGLSRSHSIVCADWASVLHEAPGRFDLVFVNPPTFSNRKGAVDFALERDQAQLFARIERTLRPGGQVVFATHARRFRLDPGPLQARAVHDLDARDYRRPPRIWILGRPDAR
jgi:23S rRNA (guanine2445-N2)-methyltransferase / 23S rRNA (guanine2069-N7)-methyltransferase